MAKIYPSDLHGLNTSEIKFAEFDTLKKLQVELAEEYSVFHSVHWSRVDEKNTVYGEIDFIILNKTGKVLVVEQKNGMLEETHDGLVKSYGLTKKVVGDQIQRNISSIRDKFNKQRQRPQRLNIDYLIYCPDYKVTAINSAGIDRERVVDGASKARLSDYIKRLLDVDTDASPELINELCSFFLSSLHIVPDVASYKSSQELLYEANSSDTPKYDCLIVDEGQDFLAGWHEIIQLFLMEDAVQLWLEDPLQNLRGTDAVTLSGFVTYNETSNFRTPTSIAGFIKQSLGQEFRQRNMLPGLGVQMFEYSSKNQLEGKLAHRINELVKAGFKPGDIAIISCRGMDSTALRETDRLGRHYVRRFTGKYDEHENQIYTEGELIFDTIFRYKGQQAPVIILTDLDESLEVNERTRKILYCAMTRATVLLELIVEETCPWLDVFRKSI